MACHIFIDWADSPPPVEEYRVYRGNEAGNESLFPYAITTLSEFTDFAVLPGHTYSYRITVVSNGVESQDSITVVAGPVPFDPEAPDEPSVGNPLAGFAILAGSTVTVVPGMEVTAAGDVGVWPGTAITGFDAPSAISGVFHPGDFVARQGQNELTISYLAAQNALNANGNPATLLPADVGGLTLSPGVYTVPSSMAITGGLVLDAGGDPEATWIFQIPTTLTTATGNSNIVLVNGARASSVFWQVGSSATLGTATTFAGTILAQVSITVENAVYVDGRLWARTGAVTFAGDARVTLFLISPECMVPLPPSPPVTSPPNPVAPTGITATVVCPV